jgi:31-O-methyltransferase
MVEDAVPIGYHCFNRAGVHVMTDQKKLPNGLSVASINRNETDYLYQEIFCDRSYIPDGGYQLPAQPIIFDVGANIGLFAIFACLEWPDAQIFAFEPAPSVFEALQENIADRDNIAAYMMALSDVPGARDFTFYPHYTVMSGFDVDAAVDKDLVKSYIRNIAAHIDNDEERLDIIDGMGDLLKGRFAQEIISCQVDSIANFAHSCGLARIDLLKVDVEGSEASVLTGLGDHMWENLGNAVVEVADRDGELDKVMRLFQDHEMHSWIVQAHEYRDTELFVVYATREARSLLR